MNQQIKFDHLEAFLKKSAQQYGDTKKAAFLHAITILKVGQDLNSGTIDMNDHNNIHAWAAVIMMAAEGVGATREEVKSQLLGCSAALKGDFEDFMTGAAQSAEDSLLPSPEVTEYLSKLAGSSKH